MDGADGHAPHGRLSSRLDITTCWVCGTQLSTLRLKQRIGQAGSTDLELDGGEDGDGFGSHVDQQDHKERVDGDIHTHHLPCFFGGGG